MNKKFKVITINGIRGLIFTVFVVLGLIAGFIISPGWLCMKLWNYFIAEPNFLNQMNIFHGIILWLIIGLSGYALNNKRMLIGFSSSPQVLDPEELKNMLQTVKNATPPFDKTTFDDLTSTKSENEKKEDDFITRK